MVIAAAMTGILLGSATRFELRASPLESLALFPMEPLPILLFGTIALACYVAVWRAPTAWAHVAIAAGFVLVWIGPWIGVGNGSLPGRDTSSNAAVVRLTVERAYLPDPGAVVVTYATFPGEHLLASVIAITERSEPYSAIGMVLLAQTVAQALLMFTLFHRLLRDSRLAALAAMISTQGNPYSALMPVFYPGNFALVLLILALILIVGAGQRISVGRRVAFLIVAGALTITHFYTSVVLVSLALALWIAARSSVSVRLAGVVAAAVSVVAWHVYWSFRIFHAWVGAMLSTLLDLDLLAAFLRSRAGANTGAGLPLWAVVAQYASIVLTFGPGVVLAIVAALRRQWDPPAMRLAIVGLGVVGVSTVTATLAQFGSQYFRAFQYAPLFTVPIAFLWIQGTSPGFRRWATAALVACAVLLAGPSWVSFNKLASSSRDYPAERAAGKFLAGSFRDGEGLTVYSAVSFPASGWYWLPGAAPFFGELSSTLQSRAEVWEAMERVAVDLRMEAQTHGCAVLMYSDARAKASLAHAYGIEGTDPGFGRVESQLGSFLRVFDSGIAEVYAQPIRTSALGCAV